MFPAFLAYAGLLLEQELLIFVAPCQAYTPVKRNPVVRFAGAKFTCNAVKTTSIISMRMTRNIFMCSRR